MFALLLGALLLAASCTLAEQSLIGAKDDRIVYEPVEFLDKDLCKDNPNDASCPGRWWVESDDNDENNRLVGTLGPNTTLSFIFQGSSITLASQVRRLGALAFASIDNGAQTLVNFTASDGVTRSQVVYVCDGLDPTRAHTLRMAYDPASFGPIGARRWMGVDFVTVQIPDNIASSISASPPGKTDVAMTSKGSMTPATVATAVLASVAGVTLLIVSLTVFFCWWRRRRRRRVTPIDKAVSPTSRFVDPFVSPINTIRSRDFPSSPAQAPIVLVGSAASCQPSVAAEEPQREPEPPSLPPKRLKKGKLPPGPPTPPADDDLQAENERLRGQLQAYESMYRHILTSQRIVMPPIYSDPGSV